MAEEALNIKTLQLKNKKLLEIAVKKVWSGNKHLLQ